MGMFDGPRAAGREHIPVYPVVYPVLRAPILLATLAALGLNAYALHYLAFTGSALMMFTCVASVITSVYFFVTYFAAPATFNYWALLGLDILNVVFWLISFALLASQAAPLLTSGTECYYSYCYDYGLYGSDLVFAQCLAAASGIGGLCFLLYAIALVFDSLALVRHRAAGYHCQAGASRDPEKAAAADAAAASAMTTATATATATSGTPAPIAQPVAVHPHGVAPAPYYEQQAAQPQQQPPFYTTPSPSAPTPVSYVPSPTNSNADAYYAQQQQVPQQVPQQVQTPPAQYHGAAGTSVHPPAQH